MRVISHQQQVTCDSSDTLHANTNFTIEYKKGHENCMLNSTLLSILYPIGSFCHIVFILQGYVNCQTRLKSS